jgi:hypothetical protein
MELDVSHFSSQDHGHSRLFDIPEEIQLKIMFLLEPMDILALGRTCRFFAKYAENEHLW